MNEIIHADIFFFVTTIAIIIVAVCVVIVLVYLIKIFKDIKHISEKVRNESEEFVRDIGIVRQNWKEKGIRLADLLSFAGRFMGKKKKAKKGVKEQNITNNQE